MSILKRFFSLQIIKNIIRLINWIFVISFILFGSVLSITLFKTGLIFIGIGIFISPYFQEWMNQKLKISLSFSSKLVVILFGFVMALLSLEYEEDEQLSLIRLLIQTAWLNYEDEEQLNKFKAYLEIEEMKVKKKAYLMQRAEYFAELEWLYDRKYYETVITKGLPYVDFDPEVKQLVEEARTLNKQEQIETALQQAPQLMADKKFTEVYQMTVHLNQPTLQEYAAKAKKELDKILKKLRSSYERGRYSQVIEQGTPHTKFDCRFERLVKDAKKAQAERKKNKQIKKAIRKASKLIKLRQYQKTIDFIENFEYAHHSKLQRIKRQAQAQLKKMKEKQILARLRNIPPTQVESNIREYTQLLTLFPKNEKYRRKLDYYKQKLTELRKQPPLFISQKEYGDKWPFTVSQGLLECIPPGIILFRVKDKAYGMNNLAHSQNYTNINKIRKPHFDMVPIINKGLELCHP